MRMRDAPAKSHRREVSAPRRVVEWIGGIAIAALILGAVVLMGVRFLAPRAGAEIREAVSRIDDILPVEDSPLGKPVPVVLIDDMPTWLRADPTYPVEPEVGMWVRVTYEWLPATGAIRVQRWEPTERPPGAPAEDAGTGRPPG